MTVKEIVDNYHCYDSHGEGCDGDCANCEKELSDALEEYANEIYNKALDDLSAKIKWQYTNYKSMPSVNLFFEIVEQLKK